MYRLVITYELPAMCLSHQGAQDDNKAGMKNRLSTVESSMPIEVPTECLPSLPAPCAKTKGSTPRSAIEGQQRGGVSASGGSGEAGSAEFHHAISKVFRELPVSDQRSDASESPIARPT
jgi:hypothetical protein